VNNKNIINDFLRNNKEITLLAKNGKNPVLKAWQNKKVDLFDISLHSGNLGWLLKEDDLVIDIDPRNGGIESYKKLCEKFNLNLEKTVTTASGGFHVYCKKEKEVITKKNIKEFPGIDFLTKGSQCVIPGSSINGNRYLWTDSLCGRFYQQGLPKEFIDFLSKKNKVTPNEIIKKEEDKIIDFDDLISGSSVPAYKVKSMLDKLNPSMGYDDWLKVGMSLFSWNVIDGLDFWENWSKGGDNYQEGETSKKWKTFSKGGDITLGTLCHFSKIADFDNENDFINNQCEIISHSSEKELEFEIIPNIKKQKFSLINVEKLSRAIQKRFKTLCDINIKISDIRKRITIFNETALSKGGIEIDNLEIDKGIDDWTQDWVYVSTHTSYYNLNKDKFERKEGFDLACGKHIPFNETRTKPTASKYVADRGLINIVDSAGYFPFEKEKVCDFGNKKILNTFNQNSVPVEAYKYSTGGLQAIEEIQKHILFICNNDYENYEILLQWIAFQVQKPGKMLKWAPLIHGIEGVGKSFFAELLSNCLGEENVGVVSPNEITNPFNSWSVGRCVNVLEEVRVSGKNRHEVMNSLKPLISNRMIQVNSKRINQFKVHNTCNYIALTNYRDALPLKKDDRRWWVISVDIESISQLEDIMKKNESDYFSNLFGMIYDFASEIRKFFLEYEISAKFKSLKRAPMTAFKKTMIASENVDDDLDEIKDVIENSTNDLISKDFLCSSEFFNTLLIANIGNQQLTNYSKNSLLKKLGYMKHPERIFIKGKTRIIWTKKPHSTRYIRAIAEGKI